MVVPLAVFPASQVRVAAKAEGAASARVTAARRMRFLRLDFMGDFWLWVLDWMIGWGDSNDWVEV
jgi:hypothetical protein